MDDANHTGPLILVVDDFRDNREFYAVALRTSGFRVVEARTGEDAVAQAQAHSPALIVMDVTLPGVDGLEAARRIRAWPATAAIPIVSVTGHSGRAEEVRAAGCVSLLIKPFSPDRLVAEVRSAIAASGPAPEA